MQTSMGVVSLWIQFAAVLVAVQYSLSAACLMRRTEWTGRRKVEMYWYNREHQTVRRIIKKIIMEISCKAQILIVVYICQHISFLF